MRGGDAFNRTFSVVLILFGTIVLILSTSSVCKAHFGVILPSDDIVQPEESRTISVSCQFMHPFEQNFMELVRPSEFGAVIRGQKQVLTDKLTKIMMKGHTTWSMKYTLTRPGDYIFYMIPKPYWEPAEGKFIQHFTKVVVDAFGLEEGWDQPIGLKTEIVPLSRPYGLWAGNVFVGQVLVDGKPAAGCDVEIEYYNTDEKVKAPADVYVTQVVKTDSNGVFYYAMPMAGWWGFAALNDGPEMMKDGKRVPVEIGAVFWVYTRDMK